LSNPSQSLSLHDPVIWAIFAIIIAMDTAAYWFMNRLYKRYQDLQKSGITANAVITESKKFSVKNRAMLNVKYEFQSNTGDALKGSSNIEFSKTTQDEYAAGRQLQVLYNPSTKFNFPAAKLMQTLKGLGTVVKLLPFAAAATTIAVFIVIIYSTS
jgi:hypothetical protein